MLLSYQDSELGKSYVTSIVIEFNIKLYVEKLATKQFILIAKMHAYFHEGNSIRLSVSIFFSLIK